MASWITDDKPSSGSATGLVADAINDGTTTVAPSQNAVYDALALKIANPGGSNDDFLQRKAGVYTNRTIPQVKTDLGISAFAETVLDDTTALAMRTTLGIRRIGKVRPKGNSLTHLGLPNVDFYGGRDTTVLADTLFYGAPFFVDEDISPDLISLRVTSTPGSSANARCAVVEVDNDLQPSASALFDQQVVIGTGTGVFTSALTGVTLVPGKVYVPIIQSSVNVNMRSYYALRTYIDTTMPASYINQYRKSRTYAAFSGAPPAWDIISNVNGLVGIDTFFLLRW